MVKYRFRRGLIAALALAGLVGCGESDVASSPTTPAATEARAHWVGTWHSGVIDNQSSTENITFRLLVHTALGGDAVRLRFSNRYGREPLRLRNVSIALPLGGQKVPAVEATTVTAVTFGGRRDAEVPAGGELRSDPVDFALPSDADVAVTFYVPDAVSNVSAKGLTLTTSFSNAVPGADGLNSVGNGDASDDTSGLSLNQYEYRWPFLTSLEVNAPGATTVVALGDSITDGAFEVPNADTRWPDRLNDRLKASDLAGIRSVTNAGISGNQITADRDGNATQGQAALTRMAWDVFEQPNLSHVILSEGINDITVGVRGADLIAGARSVIAAAHRRGAKVIVATLTPCFGSYTATDCSLLEAERQPYNDWVLHSGEPDGVIDFNAAVKLPMMRPEIWRPELTIDYLHPNPLGLLAMAEAIPLDLLR